MCLTAALPGSIVRAVFSISFVYEIDASFLLMRYSGQVRELTTLV
jgi:hypothetical protein